MINTSKKDIEKVSYIENDSIDGRMIPLQPCYLGDSEWEFWLPTEKGLISAKMHGMADGCYFSKEPALDTDVYIEFINLIMKRAYFKSLVHFERGILEDINNLSACVCKINLFHNLWLEDKKSISHRFVSTEMEYIFKVCRSIFDLLQEVAQKIWLTFKYTDPNLTTKKLSDTFSKMVFYKNHLSSAKDISQRYLIPIELAEFYARNGNFFQWLRSYRDGISHGGKNIKSIYILDEGFAVSINDKPFKDLHFWSATSIKNNNLGSVRALIAYVILNTLNVLQDYAFTIQSIIRLPDDISPNYNIYITGEHIDILRELHKYTNGEEWVKNK